MKINVKIGPNKKNSIWQLVKNWLNRNDRNHILRHYSPRIWTFPFDKTAKSWKSMIWDIIINPFREEISDVPRRNIKNDIQDQFIRNRLEKLMPWMFS